MDSQNSSLKPNYGLYGTISAKNFTLSKVFCEITLAPEFGNIGEAILTPPNEHALWNTEWPFSLHFEGVESEYSGTTISFKAYWFSKHKNAIKCKLVELETNLKITNGNHNIYGHYSLSPNNSIAPSQWLTPKYTGEIIRDKPTKFFSIHLPSEINVRFNSLYKVSIDEDTNSTTMTPYLVAEFEYMLDNYRPSYKEIDDLLLIISFVSRQQTLCDGWQLNTNTSFIEHKRICSPHSSNNVLDMTRDKKDFEKLITSIYMKFLKSNQKELLRNIFSKIVVSQDYIIPQFFNLYSALESIIFIFKSENNQEYIIPKDDFKPIEENFMKKVREHLHGEENKNKRNLLYSNFKTVPNLPFAEAFDLFINHYKCDISDLWEPIRGSESLKNIRNKIIHGAPLDTYKEKAVADANHDLHLLVERCLLAYFKQDDIKWRTRSVLNLEARKRHETSKKNLTQ